MELREYKKKFEALHKELKADLGTDKNMIITIEGNSNVFGLGSTTEYISVKLETRM